jgi:hypothetical protein
VFRTTPEDWSVAVVSLLKRIKAFTQRINNKTTKAIAGRPERACGFQIL